MQCLSAGSDQAWLEAYVTFVTLDPHTKKPMKIPAIVPTTDEERKAFQAGAARANAKKIRRKQQKHTAADATDIEQQAAQLLERAGPLLTMPSLADPHSILLSHTAMQNAMIAQPQAQNLHHRVFGGFLMRRAFELAFSNAYLFGGTRPVFLEVDEVSFASPVDVGDLLVFHSRVLYTEPGSSTATKTSQSPTTTTTTLLHIEVEAWVTEPEHVSARMSNQFYFTFAVHNEKAVRTVLPANLDEARRIATRMAVDQEQAREDTERT
jgi:acyl-coenzyme A thioesterase 9